MESKPKKRTLDEFKEDTKTLLKDAEQNSTKRKILWNQLQNTVFKKARICVFRFDEHTSTSRVLFDDNDVSAELFKWVNATGLKKEQVEELNSCVPPFPNDVFVESTDESKKDTWFLSDRYKYNSDCAERVALFMNHADVSVVIEDVL